MTRSVRSCAVSPWTNSPVWNGSAASVPGRSPSTVCGEVARYSADAWRRLGSAGLTGLWQVSGRSDLSGRSRCGGSYYVDNSSLILDLSILWRTIHAVFGRNGAY